MIGLGSELVMCSHMFVQLTDLNFMLQVVAHVVFVHQSVGQYSTLFAQKLRRNNYVTPKNYLDFINR